MEPKKIGNFILKLRKGNGLTQQEFANMFGVTYQAVSKWENGKNIPDLLILKAICKKFNININELLDGEKSKTKNKYIPLLIISFILIIISIIIINHFNNNSDFEFKTLSSECSNFNIFGSVAFNTVKSHIYISKIEYCGGNDTTKYTKVECTLYETNGNTDIRVDSYTKEEVSGITLEEFLKDLTFHIDDYESDCPEFNNSNFFLQINATTKEEKVISYKIPLSSNAKCSLD